MIDSASKYNLARLNVDSCYGGTQAVKAYSSVSTSGKHKGKMYSCI